jgi:ELP3 family radical SAM enzyme/protein acetyltransferase
MCVCVRVCVCVRAHVPACCARCARHKRKIYPTEVVPWTVIADWHAAGKYWPYSDNELVELLVWVKSLIHPWIRINRVRRDIPMQYVLGVAAGQDMLMDRSGEGGVPPNLRHDVTALMRARGLHCSCIRCREIGATKLLVPAVRLSGTNNDDQPGPTLLERYYDASCGQEVFLSYEYVKSAGDELQPEPALLCGFLRLRLPCRSSPGCCVFPELSGTALVRELHVYGQLQPTAEALVARADGRDRSRPEENAAQHSGIGRKLLERAEVIAASKGWERMAVIAGVGARNYYRKFGYVLLDDEVEGLGKSMHRYTGGTSSSSGIGGGASSGGYMIKPLIQESPARAVPEAKCSSCAAETVWAAVVIVAVLAWKR